MSNAQLRVARIAGLSAVSLCLAVSVAADSLAVAAELGPVPQWIWSDPLPTSGQVALLRTQFEVPEGLTKAELDCLADDTATVFLGGRRVAKVVQHAAWEHFDVTADVQRGLNVLAVKGTNRRGYAGVALKLRLQFEDGRQQTIVSDPTWRASSSPGAYGKFESGADGFDGTRSVPTTDWRSSDFVDDDWLFATSFGQVGVPPWGDPAGETGDYYQWEQARGSQAATGAADVRVAPGFEVELIRSSQPGEESWISLAFDPQGRLIIGKEGSEGNLGLLRLTLATEPGGTVQVESINDTLNEPRGLLFAHESLYVNSNNDLTLFRLRDLDADDRFEDVQPLRQTPGGVGHGRNNLVLGPDERLYLVHGNDVRLPEDFVPGATPVIHAANDTLHQCRWDRVLFDTQARLPAGHIIRTDLEGKTWEVFACGLRNPYGADFNVDGELFTFDADNEGDLGTPWYRPTRVNHLVSGGDYGWRQGTAMRPSWYPDSLPSNLDIGKSSPTDVQFARYSRFPPPYDRSLFILDWSYGRIYAVQFEPRGASYCATAEAFIEGRPLNVTDLAFGPDGWLYFTTGGRGTQSGLYRVRTAPAADSQQRPHSANVTPPAVADSCAPARELRRKLEAFHGRRDPDAVETCWPHLASADPWIRYAARIAIEHQDVGAWADRALSEERPLASVTALMALARSLPADGQLSVIIRLNELPLEDSSAQERLIALRAYQLAFTHAQPQYEPPGSNEATNPLAVGGQVADAARRRIEQLFPADCPQVNQFACELLTYLGSPRVVTVAMQLLGKADTQQEKLLWLYELRNVREGWTLDLRKRYLEQLAEADRFEGGRELSVAVFSIKSEFCVTLTPEEKSELIELLAPPPAIDSAALTANRPLVRKWHTADLESELAAIGRGRDFERGRRLFGEALCSRCHRLGGEGRPIGPDLAAVSHRFGRRDLVESVLVPSKVVDGKYRDTTLVLLSGKVVTGRIVGGDESSWLVATNAQSPFETIKIDIAEIESQTPSETSPMPEGLLDTFSAEEILDLVAYLESDGRADSSHFQP